jgi:hypothetical protein
MWQAVARAFERNAGTFDRRAALRLLSGPRVRTQAREGRTQVRARPGIGSVRSTADYAFDRTVMPDFPGTQTDTEQKTKN